MVEGGVVQLMQDRVNQPGIWYVVLDKGEADSVTFQCHNRPAINVGEEMIRIADTEQEWWVSKRGVEGITCTMTAKRTLIQLVDQVAPDRVREFAKGVKSSAEDADAFVMASILEAAVDEYETVGKWLLEGE